MTLPCGTQAYLIQNRNTRTTPPVYSLVTLQNHFTKFVTLRFRLFSWPHYGGGVPSFTGGQWWGCGNATLGTFYSMGCTYSSSYTGQD